MTAPPAPAGAVLAAESIRKMGDAGLVVTPDLVGHAGIPRRDNIEPCLPPV